jgi:hypothetical protein
MAKKTAMVQPRPVGAQQIVLSLELILKEFGNDRAYTVIEDKPNFWIIHFEGDAEPKTITIKEGKPVIN